VSDRRPLPTWLIGLLVAIAVFAAVLLVARLLGLGDDPAVEGSAVSVSIW
jgi:hypothetical protein